MREYTVPLNAVVGRTESLGDAVFDNADRFPNSTALRRRVDGQWIDVSTVEFAAQVTELAKGLIGAGIQPGERVALLSRTRYEWTLLDYAIWIAGAVTVPIYETSSAEQVSWVLEDSGAIAVIVETEKHRAGVEGLTDRMTQLRHIWQLDVPAGVDAVGALDELTAFGAEVDTAEIAKRRAGVGADDLATIIYTSGTTGRPKGCELTHRGLLTNVKAASATLPELLSDQGSTLLFLPLAHVFARIIQVGAIYTRTALGHTNDIKNLVPDFGVFKPTFILSVPRVFEKVYNSAKQKAHDDGKGKIFDAAAATAEQYSRALPNPGLGLRLRHAVFDKLVYVKLRALLGGDCLAAASGGAPLGERLGHFFRGVGIPVLEGYGLTETSAVATINDFEHGRIGTVGRPAPGVTVRIADDGEIMLAGDMLLRGYHNNPTATAEAMADGWFRTGDIGELDDAGYLKITGRKKELIVTAGGKNVAPAVLEDRLRAHPLISQCMVVGDQQPFIAALITIDAEALEGWLKRAGKPAGMTVADLVDDPDLKAEIESAVADANLAVSHAEAIKKFRILPVDFTEETGELTPSLKLKRRVVEKSFSDDIAALYATTAVR